MNVIHLNNSVEEARYSCGVLSYGRRRELGTSSPKEVTCRNCKRTHEYTYALNGQIAAREYSEYGSILIRYMPHSGDYKIYDPFVGLHIGDVRLSPGPGWIFCINKNQLWMEYGEMRWVTELLGELNMLLAEDGHVKYGVAGVIV